MSGFVGKFAIFAAMTDAFRASGYPYLMALFVIAGINSAISLFYYLRLVRLMTMSLDTEPSPATSLPLTSAPGLFVLLLTLPTVALFLAWEQLGAATVAAARSLFG